MNGGTTISGTMVLAALAGIEIFATGGLGGVHRDVETTMDVSADLTELGRTPMAVVSSGCKGFLDIPRTLEYLETQGVGVMSFADGREGDVDFPAFWSRDGVRSPFTIRNEAEAAAVICECFAVFAKTPIHSRKSYAERVFTGSGSTKYAYEIWTPLCKSDTSRIRDPKGQNRCNHITGLTRC